MTHTAAPDADLNEASKPLVLVADDQIHTTTMLQRVFELEGYRVECVYDGRAALERSRELIPDLLLLDVQMPLMNGFDVLKLLREDPKTANIPTILITAMGEPESIARGINLGADDYIPKPFHFRELLARAASKMRARKLEEELQRRTRELETLLSLSEKLNQQIEMPSLLTMIPTLALELLHGDLAAIFRLDAHQTIDASYTYVREDVIAPPTVDVALLTAHLALQPIGAQLWDVAPDYLHNAVSAMQVPLEHDGRLLGMLLLASKDMQYDPADLLLFRGISRQAALSLRNGELLEIQANYALHLEDMVTARTKELEKTQSMLIRSEKLASIGQLAASIAHEINNPLQPIKINLDDMLIDATNKVLIDPRDIEHTQQSVDRIMRIVARLMDFSRNEPPSYLNINQIIENVVSLNNKLFQHAKMQIVTQLAPLPMIYGSRDQLEQVFVNLTLNAKAAMGAGGLLKITSGLFHQDVVIKFEDTGCGIPPEHTGKIFDAFFSTKADQGNGLGLFVSYGIIQNHHGSIDVSSEVNVGTTFTIRLPAAPDAAIEDATTH